MEEEPLPDCMMDDSLLEIFDNKGDPLSLTEGVGQVEEVHAFVPPIVANLSHKKKGGNKKAPGAGNRKSGAHNKGGATKGGSTKRKAEDEDAGRGEDDHPYKIGAPLVAKFVDGTPTLANIVEKLQYQDETGALQWKYYVHFINMNRRMDEWVTTDRILLPPTAAAVELRLHREAKAKEKREAESRLRQEESEVDPGIRTRNQKRKGGDGEEDVLAPPVAAGDDSHDEHEGLDEASLKEHEEVTKVKNVYWIEFGKHVMECWYFSPFPKEFYPNGHVDCLYFCEYTMSFFRNRSELLWWQRRLGPMRHPPGNEIYRDKSLSMFEVDGQEQREYCQNLCFMAKLFLDHKTLYYNVDPFLFYILCEHDAYGFHPVGYFSKEKYSDLGYNLACILTFPSHQRKGYGRTLISFSYELSKKEGKVGSPEKPLSDLGVVSYRSYWSSVIIDFLKKHNHEEQLSVMDIANETSIMPDDISSTMQFLGLMRYVQNQGQGQYVIVNDAQLVETLAIKYPIKEPVVDPSRLHWTPILTDVKKDKFSIRSKIRPELEVEHVS